MSQACTSHSSSRILPPRANTKHSAGTPVLCATIAFILPIVHGELTVRLIVRPSSWREKTWNSPSSACSPDVWLCPDTRSVKAMIPYGIIAMLAGTTCAGTAETTARMPEMTHEASDPMASIAIGPLPSR